MHIFSKFLIFSWKPIQYLDYEGWKHHPNSDENVISMFIDYNILALLTQVMPPPPHYWVQYDLDQFCYGTPQLYGSNPFVI